MGRGRPIDRKLWPPDGSYRRLLAFFDRVHTDNGTKSLSEIAAGMSVDSRTRVSALLRGVDGTMPADERQLVELVRALGGGDDEVARGRTLYRTALKARGEPSTAKLRTATPPVSAGNVPRQLPGAIPAFAGRVAELKALNGLLDDAGTGSTVVVSAVDGTAGVGKTAMAVHWAHRVADRFPDGQLYVNLRGFDPTGSPMTSAEAVRGFLDAFEVPPERIPLGFEAQVGLYRSLLAGRRVLVVLDNARDADQVRPVLPGSPTCMAVVTSRNRLTSLITVDGAYPVTVDLLTDSEARELLAGRIDAGRVAAEPQAVEDIMSLCARLPLALSIVAARAVTHAGFSLKALAAELREARSGGMSGLDAFDGGEVDTNMRAVFSWSYQRLGAEAARMFRLLGLHPGPDVAIAAAASLTGSSPKQAGNVLAELARAHLLEERAPGRFAFHDLLGAYAAELAHIHDSAADRNIAVDRVLDHYLHTAHAAALKLYPLVGPIRVDTPMRGVTPQRFGDYEGAWTWFDAEHPVLLAAVQLAGTRGSAPHAWQLSWTLQDYFRRKGHWHDWAATQRTALVSAERQGDGYGQAHAHHGLGRACTWLARYDEAHAHLLEAVSLFEALGDQVGQAHVQADLGQMFSLQGRPEDALPHGEKGLALFRATGDRGGQAKTLNNTGWYHAQLGRSRQALVNCQEALGLFQELGDRRGESNTLDSVGYAYHHLGDYAQAIAYFRQALILRQELGDRHGNAATLTHLGDAQYASGDRAGARHSWLLALGILDDLDHSDADQVRAKLDDLDRPNP